MRRLRSSSLLAIAGLASSIGLVRAAALQLPPGMPVPATQTPAPGFPVSAPVPARLANSGVIVGAVADATTGRSVAGAVVTLAGRDATQKRLTDDKGRFYFKNVGSGDVSITATKEGFLDGASGKRRPGGTGIPLTLAEGQWVTNVTIDLWRPATIDGQVVDDAGEPVIGARVVVLCRQFVAGRPRLLPGAAKLTDDLGRYRITGLDPGEYLVAIPALQASAPVTTIENIARTGTAGIGVAVMAAIARSAGLTASASDAAIDAAGTNVILSKSINQPPTVNGISFLYPSVFYPGVPDAWAGQTVSVAPGENRTAVNFQLMPVPAARVSGRLVGPAASLKQQLVRLLRLGDEDLGAGSETAVTVAADDGTFSFPAVPIGDYTVKAIAPRAPGDSSANPAPVHWGDAPIWVVDRDVTDVTVTMQPAATLSGHVEFAGAAPLPSADALARTPVVIERADGGGDALLGRLGADGHFVVTGLMPGQYFVRVVSPPAGWSLDSVMWAGRDVSNDTLDVWSASDITDVVVTFSDQPTVVRGTVRDARGGSTSTATVLVLPSEAHALSDYGANPRRLRSVRASASGVFTIAGLPPGAYLLAAIEEADAENWQDPRKLEAWRRTGTLVTLQGGEQKTQDLRLAPKR